MLDDLALFVQIVDAGSLNAAAQLMDVPPSTLTRRLQKLEKELGCRLLHRSARKRVPTREGWQYYEQCRPLVHALQQVTVQLDNAITQVKGIVRVLAPVNLAGDVFTPAWIGFMKQYPEIELALHLSNQQQGLIESGYDLAIRVGEQPDSTLSMRRLGAISRLLLVASPAYLKRNSPINSPENLPQHYLLTAESIPVWTLRHPSGEIFRYAPQPRFCVNELRLAVEAACAGIGILYCPLSICHEYIQQEMLQVVLPEWGSRPREVVAVWPQQRYLPARVRVFIDYLVEFSANHPLLNGQN